MDINWTDEELRLAGISRRRLIGLVRKLKECSRIMGEMGLSIYGSDGSGNLIHTSRPEHNKAGKADHGAVVAWVGFGFDGGGW